MNSPFYIPRSLAILLIFFSVSSFAQKKTAPGLEIYRPTIVTLDPYIKTFDTASAKEISDFDFTVIRQKEEMTGFDTNPKKESVLDSIFKKYKEQIDFFTLITLKISQNNNLVLYGKSEDVFSYPFHATCDGTLESLQKIALEQNVTWVINPKEIIVGTTGDSKILKVEFQLYNRKLNKILLDKIFIANSKELNPYLNCQKNSLECCIDHIALEASPLIQIIINSNAEYW